MIVLKNIPIILFSITICSHALAVEPRTKPDVQVAREEEFAEREKQLAIEVSQESTPEKVRNLLYKTYLVGDPLMESNFVSAERYISTLQDHPRVKSLVELANHGNESEKQELFDNLVKMCHVYLEELPLLLNNPDISWQPSARSPGGGKAFPYLLTYVDEDASTLGLLVRMYLRMQEAIKLSHKVDDDEWFSSKQGLIFAYACDNFLNILSSRLDLQEKLSSRQLEVLKEYAHHRKTRAKDWNLELRQCVVMEFAVAFVEGERKVDDAEMRSNTDSHISLISVEESEGEKNYRWGLTRSSPLKVIQGWYVFDEEGISEHGGGGRRVAEARPMQLSLRVTKEDGFLVLNRGYAFTGSSGDQKAEADNKIEWPADATLKTYYLSEPADLTDKLQPAWKGELIRNEKVLKSIVYAVRVVEGNVPDELFDVRNTSEALSIGKEWAPIPVSLLKIRSFFIYKGLRTITNSCETTLPEL